MLNAWYGSASFTKKIIPRAVGGMVFYALQLSVTVLGGNPYVTFLIAAAAEFPVAVICYVAIRWCSRRWTMFVLYATAGTCALVVGIMPPGTDLCGRRKPLPGSLSRRPRRQTTSLVY